MEQQAKRDAGDNAVYAAHEQTHRYADELFRCCFDAGLEHARRTAPVQIDAQQLAEAILDALGNDDDMSNKQRRQVIAEEIKRQIVNLTNRMD